MSSRLIVGFCSFNLAAIVVLFILHFANKEKVVYIDSSKVINTYQGMVKARQEYQEKIAVWKANVDTLASEIQKEIRKHEKENAKMSSREKELSERLIQTKQQQLIDYQKAVNEKAEQEDVIATQKVVEEINAYIKAYGREHKYKIVLAATEYGNIAYAEEHLDITEKIIEGLNNKYQGEE